MAAIYDEFGRHHHDQLYRNSSETIDGVLLDSLEIRFIDSVSDKEKISGIIYEIFSNEKIERIVWPEDTRCTMALKAGYYKLGGLEQAISNHGGKLDTINHFYSARLSI